MPEKPGKRSKSEVSAARFITRKVNFRKLKRALLYSPGEQLTEFLGTEKYRYLVAPYCWQQGFSYSVLDRVML